jgi:hypothetical protein
MWDKQLLAVLNDALGHGHSASHDTCATGEAAAPHGGHPRPCHRRGIGAWASWGRAGRSHSASHAGGAGASHSGHGGHGLFGGRLGRAESAPDAVCRSPSSSAGSSPEPALRGLSPLPPPPPSRPPTPALSAPCSLLAADDGGAPLAGPPPAPLTAAELAQRAADALTRAAFRNAQDDAFKSPWAAAAGRQGLIARLFAKGGKMDDCTCVVAIVRDAGAVEAEEASARAGDAGLPAAASPAGA